MLETLNRFREALASLEALGRTDPMVKQNDASAQRVDRIAEYDERLH